MSKKIKMMSKGDFAPRIGMSERYSIEGVAKSRGGFSREIESRN